MLDNKKDPKFDYEYSEIILGKCPKCENQVIDKGELYGCVNYPNCNFVIFKESLGTSISATAVRELLQKRYTTKRYKLLTTKGLDDDSLPDEEKYYYANLVLKEIDGLFKIVPEIYLSLGKCPRCKNGMITERENVYKCTNDNCKAYVYKTWWEVVITPNHIRKLIGHPGTISVQKLTKSGHKKRIRLQVGELLKEGRL